MSGHYLIDRVSAKSNRWWSPCGWVDRLSNERTERPIGYRQNAGTKKPSAWLGFHLVVSLCGYQLLMINSFRLVPPRPPTVWVKSTLFIFRPLKTFLISGISFTEIIIRPLIDLARLAMSS